YSRLRLLAREMTGRMKLHPQPLAASREWRKARRQCQPVPPRQLERGSGGEVNYLHLLADQHHQVDTAHRVAPLVVVPGHDLDHRLAHDLSELGVDNAGIRV